MAADGTSQIGRNDEVFSAKKSVNVMSVMTEYPQKQTIV